MHRFTLLGFNLLTYLLLSSIANTSIHAHTSLRTHRSPCHRAYSGAHPFVACTFSCARLLVHTPSDAHISPAASTFRPSFHPCTLPFRQLFFVSTLIPPVCIISWTVRPVMGAHFFDPLSSSFLHLCAHSSMHALARRAHTAFSTSIRAHSYSSRMNSCEHPSMGPQIIPAATYGRHNWCFQLYGIKISYSFKKVIRLSSSQNFEFPNRNTFSI